MFVEIHDGRHHSLKSLKCLYLFGLIWKDLLWQVLNTSLGIFNGTIGCKIFLYKIVNSLGAILYLIGEPRKNREI